MIADFFALFPIKKWAAGLIYPPLKRSLAGTGWHVGQSIKTLLKDPTFLEYAALNPVDPFSMTHYAGIVFADFDIVRNLTSIAKPTQASFLSMLLPILIGEINT